MAKLCNKIIYIDQKKTSMRLATAEWDALDNICKRENIKRNQLIELINSRKNEAMGLTCSVRLFSIIYYYHQLNNQQGYTNAPTTPVFDAIRGIV